MKYSVLRISNGSFNLEKTDENINVIKDKYFELVRTYLNQANIDATVKIIDSNLDDYEGGKYKEHIVKATPNQTPNSTEQTPSQSE